LPLRRARTLPEQDRMQLLAEIYGVDRGRMEAFLASHSLPREKASSGAL